ncbi:MAG TPA: dihydrofolate reductase family protein [Candidatus Thermoplasmatota archaeon]|nr:dihydrofolate reductase family protein [Candidatus Thermoplasmatota archaeon]
MEKVGTPSSPTTCSVFVGTSLDGFIARPDGALDFLDAAGTEDHGFHAFLAGVDALVMGRNTFETVLGFKGPWPYGRKPVFVLSHRPVDVSTIKDGVVEHLSGPPQEVVATLAARGLRHLYVDGGATVQEFLRAGLIDRLVISRVPVLIGQGIPLFGPLPRDVALRHVATKAFAGGLVQSEYQVAR